MAGETTKRWRRGSVLVLGLGLLWGGPMVCAAEAPCPARGTETVQLAAVEARLELRLADGRLLRLAGLDPALSTPSEPDRDEQARVALAGLLAARTLTIAPLTNTPDRWGRIVAWAFAAGPADQQPTSLAGAAIAAGLGRYLSESPAHACRAALVAAEATARAQKLGLWADPYYAVLAVDDRAGFAERAGTLVVAEGRLASVKTGPYRTTMTFTDQPEHSHGGQILSATIAPRTMKLFEARGVHLLSLVGQSVRLRGLLDLRFGPQIELAGPDDLDVLPATGTPAVTAAGPG